MKKVFVLLWLSVAVLFGQNCNNKTFSLNAYSMEEGLTLYDIVGDLAEQCGLSVIFSDKRSREKLDESMSLINIKDYSLEELFDLLFNEHNLYYTYNKRKKILKISYYKVRNFNVNYINMSELSTKTVKSITVGTNAVTDGGDDSGSSSNTEGATNSDKTEIITTSTFTFWDQLKSHITQILVADEEYDKATNSVFVNRDASLVTVTGTKRQLREVGNYLTRIQTRMHKQVMIDAYILELQYTDEDSVGVDWSKFQMSLNPNAHYGDALHASQSYGWSFAANFDPTAIIKFLRTYGNVEVVSNPKVVTLNNQPAVINVGDQLSYLYQSGDISATDSGSLSSSSEYNLGSTFVGVTLNVIPEITENNQIMMRINPVTSNLLDEDELTKSTSSSSSSSTVRNMPPDTKIKQMSSIVKVRDGQRVMIGGLIEKKKEDDSSKVPVLGDIPLLGYAFSHKGTKETRTELFIILTPTLIKSEEFPSIDGRVSKRMR